MPTLKDVARLADVDPSTASRVLRGDPNQMVRPETRERILEVAASLKYRPNALARGLRTRRTDTIGLIIPTLGNVGFLEVVRGIQAAAAEARELVLLLEADEVARSNDSGDEDELYARFISDGRLDGLLVAFATLEDRHVAQLAERDVPLVLVNRRTTGYTGSVIVDDERGARAGVQHLISLGHRRIGYVGLSVETDTARRRGSGFRSALEDAGLPVNPRWVVAGPPTLAGGREGIATLLSRSGDDPPTALLVASILEAIGVLSGLRDADVDVPFDMSIVSFNDHELAAHLRPALTTVRMPNFRMGREAVRMLLRAVDGEATSDVMLRDEPEVVVRASTAPPKSD